MSVRKPSRRSDEAPPLSNGQLSAKTLQIFGLLLILASAVFWAFTARESTLLVGAGVTLSTLGWLQRAFVNAQENLPRYDPPEIEPVGEDRPKKRNEHQERGARRKR